jgi:hypothetical protein
VQKILADIVIGVIGGSVGTRANRAYPLNTHARAFVAQLVDGLGLADASEASCSLAFRGTGAQLK